MKKTIIGILVGILLCFGVFGGLYFANVISLNKQNENLPNNNANTEKEASTVRYSNYLKNRKNGLKKFFSSSMPNDLLENSGRYTEKGTSFLYEKSFSATITPEFKLVFDVDGLEKYSDFVVDEGVIDLFLVYAGNGGFQYFYYLKDDGSFKSFCVDCVWDDELKIKNENIKNVVSIGQVSDESSYDALATDIDGNVYVMR